MFGSATSSLTAIIPDSYEEIKNDMKYGLDINATVKTAAYRRNNEHRIHKEMTKL